MINRKKYVIGTAITMQQAGKRIKHEFDQEDFIQFAGEVLHLIQDYDKLLSNVIAKKEREKLITAKLRIYSCLYNRGMDKLTPAEKDVLVALMEDEDVQGVI